MDWMARWLENIFSVTILWWCILIIFTTNGQAVAVAAGICVILVVAVGVDRLIERLWEQTRFEYLIYKAVKEPDAEIHEGLQPYEGLNPTGFAATVIMLLVMLVLIKYFGTPSSVVFTTLGLGIVTTLFGILTTLTLCVGLKVWRKRQTDQTVTIRAKMRPAASKPDAPYQYIVKTGRLHEFSFKTKDNLPDWLRR